MQTPLAVLSPYRGAPYFNRGTGYALEGVTPPFIVDVPRGKYSSGALRTMSAVLPSSRTTGQTCIDSDGVLKWGLHNLLKWSNDFTNAAWTLSTGTTLVSSGDWFKLVLPSISSSSIGVSQSAVPNDGNSYSISVEAEAVEKSILGIAVTNDAGFTTTASFNLSTGSVIAVGSHPSSSVNPTAAIAIGSNGGWLCTLSADEFIAESVVHFTCADSISSPYNRNINSDGIGGINIRNPRVYRSDLGGMQLDSDGSDYLETTTAPAYAACRDYTDPTNPVIQSWDGRTNLFPMSDQFDQNVSPYWSYASITVTANAAVSPDGATNADKFIPNNAAGTAYIVDRGKITSTGTYTASVYAKAGEFTSTRLDMYSAEDSTTTTTFDLSTGTVTSGAGVIKSVGSGWYRCSLTKTFTGLTAVQVQIARNTVTGDGTSGIYIYGAQLEAGPSASPYIPTTTAAVSRGADDIQGVPVGDGVELVPNGDFTVSTGWTPDTGWSIASGIASCDGTQTGATDLYRTDVSVTDGLSYRMTIDVSNLTAGTIKIILKGNESAVISANGSHTFDFSSLVTAGSRSGVRADASFVGDIDNVSVQELLPFAGYSQSVGTMVVEGYTDTPAAAAARLFDLSDGTNSNRHINYISSGGINFLSQAAGAIQALLSSTVTATSGMNIRAVSSYKVNDFAFTVNGEAVILDTTGSVSAVTTFGFGVRYDGTQHTNGGISLAVYWPIRASNPSLVTESGK